MANKNRYWFVKRGKLGLVEDATGNVTINGVSRKYQNIQSGGLSVRYDAILKNPHFNKKTTPQLNNQFGYEGSGPMDQKPLFPEQFHEAIVYKAIALGYELTPALDVNKIQFFEAKYQSIVKKAKGFARRYYNGGTMRIKQTDF